MSSIVGGSWTAPTNTKVPADTHLATTRPILLSTGSQTVTLYTVPATALRFVLTKIVVRNPSTTLATLTVSLGSTGSTASNTSFGISASTGLQSLTTNKLSTLLSPAAASPVLQAGDTVVLTTGTGPAANSTVCVDVFGYYEQG